MTLSERLSIKETRRRILFTLAIVLVFAGLFVLLMNAHAVAQDANDPTVADESHEAKDVKDAGSDLKLGLILQITDGRRQAVFPVPALRFALQADESLHPSIAPDFKARWQGMIRIRQAGEYAFYTEGDDCEITIDGKRVQRNQPVELLQGNHILEVDYKRPQGDARLRLMWLSSRFDPEPVPGDLLSYHQSEADVQQQDKIDRGRAAVENLGCMNCHQDTTGQLWQRKAPDLATVATRTKGQWLVRWLDNPQAVNEHARMPDLLDESEARDVYAFLSSLNDDEPGPAKAQKQIDTDNVQLIERGQSLFNSIGCQACHESEDLILTDVSYKWHADALAVFLREPSDIIRDGTMPDLNLTEDDAQAITAYLHTQGAERNNAADTNAAENDTRDIEKMQTSIDNGRALFTSRNCMACHAVSGSDLKIEPAKAAVLPELDVTQGCLHPNQHANRDAAKNVPHYQLTDQQREDMAAFIGDYQANMPMHPAPVWDYFRTLQHFRCYSCHATELTDVLVDRPEVPTLIDAGAKLKPQWVHRVLTGDTRSRTWLDIRMPNFTSERTEKLPAHMAKASGMPSEQPPAEKFVNDDLALRGVELIGSDAARGGLACLSCHDWGDQRSFGEHGPQLQTLNERVRFDWFTRWMKAPSRIRDGTSMPTYFVDVAHDEAMHDIRSLWAAFAMGKDMPEPPGLTEALNEAELTPMPRVNQAAVVRWHMPRSSPASIAVGLPGDLSYCFDAAAVHLRYAWQGGFVDIAPTLPKNTQSPTILGEIFYEQKAFPFRVAGKNNVPQAEFKGYRLVDGLPTFHYTIDDLDVYERITHFEDDNHTGMVRVLTLPVVDRPVLFVAPVSDELTIDTSLEVNGEGFIVLPRGKNILLRIEIKSEKDAY